MKTYKQRYIEAQEDIRILKEIISTTTDMINRKELLPASESKRIKELKTEMIELINEMYQSDISHALNLRARLSVFKLKLLTFY